MPKRLELRSSLENVCLAVKKKRVSQNHLSTDEPNSIIDDDPIRTEYTNRWIKLICIIVTVNSPTYNTNQ